MLINSIIKNNQGLPEYNYYLDVTDFLIKEAKQTIKENSSRKLPKKIEEIEGNLMLALDLFKKERNDLNDIQVKGFVLKKNLIKSRLELLKIFH